MSEYNPINRIVATEDGIIKREDWVTLSTAGGEPLGPAGDLEWDAATGTVRRKQEHVLVSIQPPWRPL